MSRKNHQMVNGRLLQMDKKFSALKEKQKIKIAEWIYEAYRKCYVESGKIPTKKNDGEILSDVFVQIEEAQIWIPDGEIYAYFAIFLPSISTGDTTQNVLSAYVSEFNGDITTELNDLEGCDRSEKVYVNFGGEGIPDNYCDILVVYMVKYGDGDTATDMTDKAKENLKSVFDDMCSYTTSTGTETDTDAEGNETEVSVKYVNVTLKTYQDMISEYGFNTEEQEMLAELMKPENLMMLGYSGNNGGQTISPEQYQAIVDAISDENGRKVVEFALSKVGYPYSQELRHSGTHFDCSSLAYYAWQYAGVDIEYLGATTAAYEGQYCYDNNWLVHYDEMQPGDLIFFSYEQNGAFMNISHVAIYVGDGMLVEAANSRIGVVYRQVHSQDSIVMIGRPR